MRIPLLDEITDFTPIPSMPDADDNISTGHSRQAPAGFPTANLTVAPAMNEDAACADNERALIAAPAARETEAGAQ
jgi:hypothetical protein